MNSIAADLKKADEHLGFPEVLALPLRVPHLARWGFSTLGSLLHRCIRDPLLRGILSAQAGNPGQTNYAAAKAGLIGATRALALEVAKRGVTVNAIAPGLIDTGMLGERFPPERVRDLVPAGRMGEPGEVAALVGYLVSDDAQYVSGQVLAINGAMYR